MTQNQPDLANFDIHITPLPDGRYQLTATSPYGETESAVQQTLPSDTNTQDLGDYLRDLIANADDALTYGQALHRFLFPPTIANLWQQSLAYIQGQANTTLRLCLRLGSDIPELSQIPWEYCHDGEEFLALRPQTPLLRYHPMPQPPPRLALPSPVRVLLVAANPHDLPPLQTELEVDHVQTALLPLLESNRIMLKVVSHATRARLQQQIDQWDPHILHFMGHGDYDTAKAGFLALEDEQGNKDPVTAKQLRVLLQGNNLQLVILTACQTAVGPYHQNRALMGVAAQLVAANIPAVIAIQFNLPDQTAITFSHLFYQQLVREGALDAALTKARRALYFREGDKTFWGIPALFTRLPDARLWAPRPAPKVNVPSELRPYLETLVQRNERLPLIPLDPRGRENAPIDLRNVFINLHLREQAFQPMPLSSHQVEHIAAALGHIHQQRRFILLGDPGSGKSTLMRYLTYCLARAALEPEGEWLTALQWTVEIRQIKEIDLPPRLIREDEDKPLETYTAYWQDDLPIPILLNLRDFANSDFTPNSPLALWHFVENQLNEVEDMAAVVEPLKAKAQAGKVFFLLDGVDEVPTEKRAAIWQAITSLQKGVYGRNRWLATCRILSFSDDEAPANVEARTLAGLTNEQISRFVHNWYMALHKLGELDQEQMQNRIASLQQAATGELNGLASNPMLLTIMALVQTYHGRLPRERVKLYKACVEILMLRWQVHKEQGEGLPTILADLGISQEDLERLLWDIAWQAHSQAREREEAADIPGSEIMEIAVRYFENDWEKAGRFLKYTEERAHLLLARGGRSGPTYAFPHRTFQEYLAACSLTPGMDLMEKAPELAAEGDAWREVLRLAAEELVFNRNNREMVLYAVREMVPEELPTEIDPNLWYPIWLAGEMALVVGVETIEKHRVGQRLLPRLQQQLGALVSDGRLTPRQRAEAGVTLGWLGDSRPDVVCEIPHMITIPAGPFLMGSDKTVDGQAAGDEQPQHTLSLPAYAIGKYPITVAQYRRFVAAGGYRERAYWTDAGWQQKEKESWTEPAYWQDVRWTIPNHPVVGISWYEAVAYCNWLKATTGREFRLPDEAMWEKAARGTDGRIYSWGNEWNANHLNADETGIGGTTAVGLFPSGQSPFGVLDMSGNVLEWCSGVGYVKVSYPFQRQSYEEDLVASGTRIWRGGAFNDLDGLTRAASRYYGGNPHYRSSFIGFRVAEHLSYPVS